MELVIEAETLDAAIKKGLNKIGKKREEVRVIILEKGNQDFLRLTGDRPSKVKIIYESRKNQDAQEITDSIIKEVEDLLKGLLEEMKFTVELRTEVIENELRIEIISKNSSLIIGRRGKTLNALQLIINYIVNKDRKRKKVNIVIDSENYREKRRVSLEILARKLANKVKKTRRRIILDPMSSFERRIIHTCLAQIDGVDSESIDAYPYRKVVIKLDRKKSSSNPG